MGGDIGRALVDRTVTEHVIFCYVETVNREPFGYATFRRSGDREDGTV
jgi:hypothetical protein